MKKSVVIAIIIIVLIAAIGLMQLTGRAIEDPAIAPEIVRAPSVCHSQKPCAFEIDSANVGGQFGYEFWWTYYYSDESTSKDCHEDWNSFDSECTTDPANQGDRLIWSGYVSDSEYSFARQLKDGDNIDKTLVGVKMRVRTVKDKGGGDMSYSGFTEHDIKIIGTSENPLNVGVYKNGAWKVLGMDTMTFGNSSVVQIVPGDYDGDGITDPSYYNNNYDWYIKYSGNDSPGKSHVGFSGIKLAPADYDGDGRTDVALFASSGSAAGWYIFRSKLGYIGPLDAPFIGPENGDLRSIPLPADYDGDGIIDFAMYCDDCKNNNDWFILKSSNQEVLKIDYGGTSYDVPVPGDYNGDGKTDIAIYRRDKGEWYIMEIDGTNIINGDKFGALGWYALSPTNYPKDYNNDGKDDAVLYSPTTGEFAIAIINSTGQLSFLQKSYIATGGLLFTGYFESTAPIPGEACTHGNATCYNTTQSMACIEGEWSVPQNCTANQVCADGMCSTCSEGSMKCINSTAFVNCTNEAWESHENTCQSGICNQQTNQCVDCIDGKKKCANTDSYQECSNGVWGSPTACGQELSCSGDGVCSEEINCTDSDGDGFNITQEGCGSSLTFDCDDNNASIKPGLDEACDGIDNNCMNGIDEGCACTSGDTRECGSGTEVGECQNGTQTCVNSLWQNCTGAVIPNKEVCDGKDNDCDGETDEEILLKLCGTDIGRCTVGLLSCANGVEVCNGSISPLEFEICNNGFDDDCDGVTDEADCSILGCEGCLYDDNCFTYGFRLNIDNVPSYCAENRNFTAQKDIDATCLSNYECISNFCSDTKCVSIVEEIRSQTSVLWQILCWIMHPVNSDNRDDCFDEHSVIV